MCSLSACGIQMKKNTVNKKNLCIRKRLTHIPTYTQTYKNFNTKIEYQTHSSTCLPIGNFIVVYDFSHSTIKICIYNVWIICVRFAYADRCSYCCCHNSTAKYINSSSVIPLNLNVILLFGLDFYTVI